MFVISSDEIAVPDTEVVSKPTPYFVPKPKIPKGITISDISVGGLTEEKAIERIQNSIANNLTQTPMIITYGDNELSLAPDLTSVQWNIASSVQRAMQGQSNDLELSVNKQYIENEIRKFFAPLGGIYSPSGFWTEGNQPDLEKMSGDGQTLVLNPGCSGLVLDIYDILDQITESYRNGTYYVAISKTDEYREVKPLDLEGVFKQVATLPVNPDLDRVTLEVIPGKVGYGFDISQAADLMKQSTNGNPVRIKMQYLQPELSEEDVWFLDTLGYCKTEVTDNENRNENIRLACSMLNGKILQPGETISYNETLGKRTREAGYKPAPAYSGTELVDEIGGGICQVSSTLYLSSLFAELNVVERKNHGFPANYIPMGLDATVNWGTTDLKIRNDYELPVKILAELSDGYVKVKIQGVEQRDYYVKMEYRVDDHPSYAAAFRCRYDRYTDEMISRTLHHTSIYLEEVWCWPGFAENAKDE